MPRGWIRFAGFIIISTLVHAILIWALQRMVMNQRPAKPLSKPPIQARLVKLPKPPEPPVIPDEPEVATEAEVASAPTEPPAKADPHPEKEVATSPAQPTKQTLSAETKQRIEQILLPNTPTKTNNKRGMRRFIPDSLSTASLPEHLQNKAPVEQQGSHEFNKPKDTVTYPESSPIQEEYRMADGSTLVKMKSGGCVLVQDQQQLDPQLTGKMWLAYGGAGCDQDDESLAWKAFKQRIAKHAQ